MNRDAPLPAAPARAEASSSRLVATLAGAGLVSGLIVVVVFGATRPAIERHRAEAERAAVLEVLSGPVRFETLYASGGRLGPDAPAGASAGAERAFLGFDASGKPVGFALVSSAPGYADAVVVMFGYEPESRRVLGIKVLESRETPGLGDAVEKDPGFGKRFVGAEAPIVPVKPGRGTGDSHEVDTISGATISSRAVIRAVNDGVRRWEPLLLEYLGRRTP